MSPWAWAALTLTAAASCGCGLAVGRAFLNRGMDRWVIPHLLQSARRRSPRPGDDVHVLLCVADHYEPKWNDATAETARARVASWVAEYPRLFGGFRDSDGRPPRHSFFYPVEEYEPELLDALAALCRDGYGEVEIHLHHDDDTAENLRKSLTDFAGLLDRRHGLLPRDRRTGALAYGFVHGNWALDNSRPDGRWCGVNNELDVLRETGCYADFTLPSAPSPAQTRKINSIYYAVDDPARPKSHDTGTDVGAGPAPPGGLMIIQGPLVLDWRRRKWGVFPATENGAIQPSQPASVSRLRSWLRAGVRVPTRPDWVFVKLHTHGTPEWNRPFILGDRMVAFHRGLADLAAADPRFHYHYVTAREMYNLAKAAEAGWAGTVADARDFLLVWDGHHGGTPEPTRSPGAGAGG